MMSKELIIIYKCLLFAKHPKILKIYETVEIVIFSLIIELEVKILKSNKANNFNKKLLRDNREICKARQGKARQGKARQGKARQGKARQGKARQGKARQGKANTTSKEQSYCSLKLIYARL